MFLLVSSNHCDLTVKANIVLVPDPRSLECLTSGPQGMGRWCYFSQHTEQPSPEGQPPLRPCTGSQLLGQSPETLPPTHPLFLHSQASPTSTALGTLSITHHFNRLRLSLKPWKSPWIQSPSHPLGFLLKMNPSGQRHKRARLPAWKGENRTARGRRNLDEILQHIVVMEVFHVLVLGVIAI